MPKEKPSIEDRNDVVHFTRHSKAGYKTYGKIKVSENPRASVDIEQQVTPDLPEQGVELAHEKAEEFFSRLNPETDILFFVSSSEARALETANIYRQAAHLKGFEVLKPENVRGKMAEEIGEGEIRTLRNLSLNIKDTLLASIFEPESHQSPVNWEAVDGDFKQRWAKAREIIKQQDYGSYGANLFHYSEEIQKIFPELKSTKDLYDTQFLNLVRLAEFGLKKAKESGLAKNVKILAFGHENYMGYALDKYFKDHEIKNCETIGIDLSDAGITLERRGEVKVLGDK